MADPGRRSLFEENQMGYAQIENTRRVVAESTWSVAMLTKLGLALCLLLSASSVGASVIQFSHDGGGLSSVGGGGFFLETELDFFGTDTADVNQVGFSLATRNPASIIIDDSGGSTYVFNHGVVTFTFESRISKVKVLPFTLELSPAIYDPTWGGDGPVALMPGLLDLTLGSGKLSQSLAQALGVKKKTRGGGLSFIVDDFRGDPLADARPGVPNFLDGSLDATTAKGKLKKGNDQRAIAQSVPEPALLSLLLAGGALGVLRRRRS
jgi:hypothetical protein